MGSSLKSTQQNGLDKVVDLQYNYDFFSNVSTSDSDLSLCFFLDSRDNLRVRTIDVVRIHGYRLERAIRPGVLSIAFFFESNLY